MKIFKKKEFNFVCLIAVFSFTLSPYGYALQEGGFFDKEINYYCNFGGILAKENREKEFSMLEEERFDTPNFKMMRKILSDFVGISKSAISNCPTLRNYLADLVTYVTVTNANNEKITENTREIINYIAQEKLVSG